MNVCVHPGDAGAPPRLESEGLRAALYGVVVGLAVLLAMDAAALVEGWTRAHARPVRQIVHVVPVHLPETRVPPAPRHETASMSMRFAPGPDGALAATGSIDAGAAQRLAAVLDAHGGAITTLFLDSPGGALDEALAMSRLVRERGLRTHVASGAVCASSCPLVMAGGTQRAAHEGAAIGLHQFYAADRGVEAARAMSDAQLTAALIARHLAAMGVDPALWLHALDTPPQSLYQLSLDEMRHYRLVTEAAAAGS